jgi:hypothetical protein
MTAAIMYGLPFFFKPYLSHGPMKENRAKQAGNKTTLAYFILTVAFIIIFGGITLLGIFIAHLSA